MRRDDPVLRTFDVSEAAWAEVQNEVVTFIDGGVGQVRISSQVPILLRVGSYCVRTGERQLSEREAFGYYPIVLGDLEGGTKTRKDFIDIVRITAELLGGLAALERTPDLDVLMFHGPLVYMVGGYAGHSPLLSVTSISSSDSTARRIVWQCHEGRLPSRGSTRHLSVHDPRVGRLDRSSSIEPLAWIAYLYRRLIRTAAERNPVPIISGVVERGSLREFIEECCLIECTGVACERARRLLQ